MSTGRFSIVLFFFIDFNLFFSAFHWSLSIGKPRTIPVSFVKTTEPLEVSLVTINRQTSLDSGILRQDYRIIRGLPLNPTRCDDWVTIYRNRPKREGLITESD